MKRKATAKNVDTLYILVHRNEVESRAAMKCIFGHSWVRSRARYAVWALRTVCTSKRRKICKYFMVSISCGLTSKNVLWRNRFATANRGLVGLLKDLRKWVAETLCQLRRYQLNIQIFVDKLTNSYVSNHGNLKASLQPAIIFAPQQN